MRAQTIAQLAWYKPRSKNAARLYGCADIKGLTPKRASDIIHYTECHRNVQFGWDFAASMHEVESPFPALLHGDDLVVWRAYQYLNGAEDPAVAGAIALTMPSQANTRNQIRALLVADNVDCQFVADHLTIPLGVIKAYEKLFFNVLDRKKDHSYIASIVYPNGRIVEAYENYLEEAGIGDLMLRAGYAKGFQHVLYAAGLGNNPYATKGAADGAQELDSMFMADGCLYASLGWLHQSRNAMPITNARLSMQATKMGNSGAGSGVGVISLGDSMLGELQYLSEKKAEIAMRALALQSIEVDAEVTTPS